MAQTQHTTIWARNLLFFAGCALAWFVLDQVVKSFCEGQGLGTVIVDDVMGLCQIVTVHNFGAAWSLFEGNVLALAGLAVVICAALLGFAIYESKRASLLEMFALALVFAGGIGNMVDRLTLGYVVDMIRPTFIDFPTFNVADIGVTCGIALMFVVIFLQFRFESQSDKED